jgi:SagB-type dehydrogenase family enzyme
MGIGATLALWEVEDAVFHSHSRLGHRHQAYGATYRGRDRLPAPPAIAAAEGPIIPLPTPGRATSPGANRPFFAVLEARRSLRPRGVTPLDLTVLGEFLHHAARNRQVPAFGQDGMEWISRPYPGAGGCHPIEVHVLAHRCTPLDRGLYRYDPAGHGLVALGAAPGHLDKLLADARRAARLAADPPVLIILAARFARAIWKYEGIAYANILKDAGGLIQTMYLVATAMGLAPCALGGGDAACFAAAIGKGVWEQSSVGEFILGHSRESDP